MAAARRRFLAAGYSEVTLRSVADEAGVDVALLGYYFGSKQALFVEALAALEQRAQRLTAATAAGDLATLPARLLNELLQTWDADRRGAAVKAIASGAMEHPEIRDVYARTIETTLVDSVAALLDGPDARDRASAFTLMVIGVAYTRYILPVEPLASMAAADLVNLLSPALTVALLGPD